MRSNEHLLGWQMRATVRDGNAGTGAIHAQTRAQETPLAESHSEDNGRAGLILFNNQAPRWLGVSMDEHLTFKKHHIQCLKKPSAAETRL